VRRVAAQEKRIKRETLLRLLSLSSSIWGAGGKFSDFLEKIFAVVPAKQAGCRAGRRLPAGGEIRRCLSGKYMQWLGWGFPGGK
jgi:hypothetical protein